MDARTEAVYSKFAAGNWNQMSQQQRLQALQELEAVSAGQNNSAVMQVVARPLNGKAYGYFDGEKIVVNAHLLEDNAKFHVQIKDEEGNVMVMTHDVADANLQMMDTLFHEDYHAFQQQAVDGEIPQEVLDKMGITQETVRNWAANENRLGYVDPEIDGNLYRIQGLEKTAFDAGEKNTKQAFSYLNGKYGEDANYQKYLENISANSYEKNLQMAQMRYGDMDIENTLQMKINELNYMDQVKYSNEISADDVQNVLIRSALHSNSNVSDSAVKAGNGAVNAASDTGSGPVISPGGSRGGAFSGGLSGGSSFSGGLSGGGSFSGSLSGGSRGIGGGAGNNAGGSMGSAGDAGGGDTGGGSSNGGMENG